MYTEEKLKELQALSLEDKIALSKLRITEFYEHYDGNVVVSFSGGKDSTVLLHLVRSVYPHVGLITKYLKTYASMFKRNQEWTHCLLTTAK